MHSKPQKRSAQDAYGSADMTASASYGQSREQQLAAQRQYKAQVQAQQAMHNDSLFESSKASTNYPTNMGKRPLQPGKRGGGPNQFLSSQKKPDGSAMVGTQESNQGKSEAFQDLRKPHDSIIGEQSFAAENVQTMDNEADD